MDHIEALGLTRWVRRSLAPSVPAVSAAGPETIQPGKAPVATVLVLAPAGLTLGANDPAGSLLAKILGALQIPLARFRIVRVDAGAAADGAVAPGPVLAFTGSPPAGMPDAIVLPTISEMLADAAQKRPAWERLKPLVGKLGP
ncbi:MAG: hypothetical protein AAGE01_25945 [Pseudomonadota bacterium]